MIESKEQVLGDFRQKAQAFLAEPSFVTGIDLDDASVTLKRYVLTVMQDEALGSALARVQKQIRALDVAAVSELLAQVESKLAD